MLRIEVTANTPLGDEANEALIQHEDDRQFWNQGWRRSMNSLNWYVAFPIPIYYY